jgi:hypothetical protein
MDLLLSLTGVSPMGIRSSHVSFKWSEVSAHRRDLLPWQVVGSIAGFATVLNLTALTKLVLRHHADAICVGLGFVLVQDNLRAFHLPQVTEQTFLAVALLATGSALISLECGA